MSKINTDTARKVARLAHLNFDDNTLANITTKFAHVMDYVDQLANLSTENVEPTDHATAETNDNVNALGKDLRKDEVIKFKDSEKILEAAPKRKGRFFEVPKVIDNE